MSVTEKLKIIEKIQNGVSKASISMNMKSSIAQYEAGWRKKTNDVSLWIQWKRKKPSQKVNKSW